MVGMQCELDIALLLLELPDVYALTVPGPLARVSVVDLRRPDLGKRRSIL